MERKHAWRCSHYHVLKKSKKKKLTPEDNLTICRGTASLCSENDKRGNHGAEELSKGSKRQRSSATLDRWYNLGKERGWESYEFKN